MRESRGLVRLVLAGAMWWLLAMPAAWADVSGATIYRACGGFTGENIWFESAADAAAWCRLQAGEELVLDGTEYTESTWEHGTVYRYCLKAADGSPGGCRSVWAYSCDGDQEIVTQIGNEAVPVQALSCEVPAPAQRANELLMYVLGVGVFVAAALGFSEGRRV